MKQPKEIDLLGVRVDALTIDEAWARLPDLARSGRAHYIVKPYVEFLDRAARDPEIVRLLNGSTLCLPDGVALQWAALYLHGGRHNLIRLFSTLASIVLAPARMTRVLPQRFAGATAAWSMLEVCRTQNLSVYLVGRPKGGTIDDTAVCIAARLPGLQVIGTFDGYEANDRYDELREELARLRPDVILVGTGFPRQERLMARLATELPHGVFIGEGGTFDYDSFGGRRRRSPALLRRAGLEWLWRLMLEPNRLRRQLAVPRFIVQVYRAGRHRKTTD